MSGGLGYKLIKWRHNYNQIPCRISILFPGILYKKTIISRSPCASNGPCSMEESALIRNFSMAAIIIWRAERSFAIYDLCFVPHVKSLREIRWNICVFLFSFMGRSTKALCVVFIVAKYRIYRLNKTDRAWFRDQPAIFSISWDTCSPTDLFCCY